jgi:glycosyltransferase involved in cell wall biosynthesis
MIDILLATYQGEKYLVEQIESIIAQTNTDWTLLIHDDGSSDATTKITQQYSKAYPSKIKVIVDGIRTGGAKNNFAHLLAKSSADYVMFCDQDDVWLETKIDIFIRKMNLLEEIYGKNTPIVIFSDVHIVAEDLTPIASSGWKHLCNGPQFSESLELLASRNCIFGCAMMVNRRGILVSSPIPHEAVMHDWWIGLCTLRHHGKLIPIAEQTILYRQHNFNAVGAKSYNIFYKVKRLMAFNAMVSDFIKVYSMVRSIGVTNNWIHFLYLKLLAQKKV